MIHKDEIKEVDTPVIKRGIKSRILVCFTSKKEGICLESPNSRQYKYGDKVRALVEHDNKDHWEDVK